MRQINWIIVGVVVAGILAIFGINIRFTHGDVTVDISRGGEEGQIHGETSPTELEEPAPPTESENVAKQSPQEFVRSYYSTINERKINSAWELLTPEFQTNNASGLEKYTEWWEKVRTVTIRDVYTINEEVPKVGVDISYLMMNGERVDEQTLIYTLTWNEAMNSWQISDGEKLE